MDAMLIDDNSEDEKREQFVNAIDRLSVYFHADTDTYVLTEQELQNYSSAIAAEWLRIAKSEQYLSDALQRQVNKLQAQVAQLQVSEAEANQLLCAWDALIEFQYTGSKTAMSMMQLCAFNTKDFLDDKPSNWFERKILEARIDERRFLDNCSAREYELKAQLAALEGEKS